MRVLVVEDDPGIGQAVRKVLERSGYEVVIVDNGIAAFAEIQQGPFSAVLCDYRLPFLDGKRFYQQIADDYPETAARLVFVSGWIDADTRAFFEETGRPFISKPFDLNVLLSTVRAVAQGSEPLDRPPDGQ